MTREEAPAHSDPAFTNDEATTHLLALAMSLEEVGVLMLTPYAPPRSWALRYIAAARCLVAAGALAEPTPGFFQATELGNDLIEFFVGRRLHG